MSTRIKFRFLPKKFSDIKLVYCERYFSEHEAAMREKQLKGWSQKKKQMLVEGKLGINSYTELVEDLLRERESLP